MRSKRILSLLLSVVLLVSVVSCLSFVSPVSAASYKCATPTFKTIETLEHGIRFTWDPVPDAELYRVYYRGSDGWNCMVTTARTSFMEMDVHHDTSYIYTIRIVNYDEDVFLSDFNSSGWRAYYYNTPTMGTSACLSVDANIVNNQGYFTLVWKDVDAPKYNVEMRYEGETNWQTVAKNCTGTRYVHYINSSTKVGKDLTRARAYRVYAVDENGRKASGAAVSPYKLRKSGSVYGRGTWLKWLMDAAGYKVDFSWSTAQTYDKAVEYGILTGWRDSDVYEGLRRQYVADTMMRAFKYKPHPISCVYDVGRDFMDSNHASRLTKAGNNYYANDTQNKNLNTIAYYGWFTPDYYGKLFPNGHISADDFDELKTSLAVYKKWRGKTLVSFGDSVMHGSGNILYAGNYADTLPDSSRVDKVNHRFPRYDSVRIEGLAEMFGEKYGMKHKDYSFPGATMGVRVTWNSDSDNDAQYEFHGDTSYKYHVANQVRTAIKEGQKADLIFVNGDNDLHMSSIDLDDILFEGDVWDYGYSTVNQFSGRKRTTVPNGSGAYSYYGPKQRTLMNYDKESSFTKGMQMAINLIRNKASYSDSVVQSDSIVQSQMAKAPIVMVRAHESGLGSLKNQCDYGERIIETAEKNSNCYGFDAYNWGDFTGAYKWADYIFVKGSVSNGIEDHRGVHNNGRGEAFHYLPGLEYTVRTIK